MGASWYFCEQAGEGYARLLERPPRTRVPRQRRRDAVEDRCGEVRRQPRLGGSIETTAPGNRRGGAARAALWAAAETRPASPPVNRLDPAAAGSRARGTAGRARAGKPPHDLA